MGQGQEENASLRMLKKSRLLTRPTLARRDAPSPKQGRRRIETGGGTDRTSWGRSPIQWILANGKTPPALPPTEDINRYVEDFGEPRTKLAGVFSILLAVKDAFGRYQFAFDDCADRGQTLRRGGFKP
jgi:hypothetical protein